MKEQYRHYRGPEITPEAAYAHIAADITTTAERHWRPAEEPGTFTATNSAAGRELAASLPGAIDIAVNQPSRRMNEAISRIMAFHSPGDTIMVTVLEPHEAARADHRGVGIAVRAQGVDEPIFEGTLEYGMFLHFVDISGLCEPANRRQRMGRWLVGVLEQYVEDQNSAYQAGSWRHPPNFGAW